MNPKEQLNKILTEPRIEKLAKCIAAVFVIVLSVYVLAVKVPSSKLIEDTTASIKESQGTVMEFSGATIATSLAISALPDDFASPLAGTLADLNTYFIFVFVVLFVEELIMVEGVRLAFLYVIPAACVLYILYVICGKMMFKSFSAKLMVLGLAVVLVIPLSTQFTEKVCADYLDYVDETIEEANAGANKVNEVMVSGDGEETIFEKLSEAFKTAIQGMTDLLSYFENVIKRCVNSIAIMIVTSFVLPMLTLFLFRWLLNELFAWNLPKPQMNIRQTKLKKGEDPVLKIEDKGEDA